MEPGRATVQLRLADDFAVDRSRQSKTHLKTTSDAADDYLVKTVGSQSAIRLSEAATSHCGCRSLRAARSAANFNLPVGTQPKANAEMCLSGLSGYLATRTDSLGFWRLANYTT